MLLPVVHNCALKLVLKQVQMILHPPFTFWLYFLKCIEFYFVLSAVHHINLNIILLCELFPPNFAPFKAKVPHYAKFICIAFHTRCQDYIGTT